jgi:hypothetical protein
MSAYLVVNCMITNQEGFQKYLQQVQQALDIFPKYGAEILATDNASEPVEGTQDREPSSSASRRKKRHGTGTKAPNTRRSSTTGSTTAKASACSATRSRRSDRHGSTPVELSKVTVVVIAPILGHDPQWIRDVASHATSCGT